MRQEAERLAIGSVCQDCDNPHWQDCSMHDHCEDFQDEVQATLKEWEAEE